MSGRTLSQQKQMALQVQPRKSAHPFCEIYQTYVRSIVGRQGWDVKEFLVITPFLVLKQAQNLTMH